MKLPKSIRETSGVREYLQSRNLLSQYQKNKNYIIYGISGSTDFKKRKPNGSGMWSFRITKKFRAIGYFDQEGDFIVTMIDDHQ
ncbi:MAG: hypothetical protein CO170_01385 [candidate division SR1 bacterium CG_4_9_14_3_um_filter_40_9]|nr:MAG: hypothetical protein CO170_01385 [candidate division SR1 bacterium CG_4_9_14_3_um_filter_40_9]